MRAIVTLFLLLVVVALTPGSRADDGDGDDSNSHGILCRSACDVAQDKTGEATQLIKYMCRCLGWEKFSTTAFPTTITPRRVKPVTTDLPSSPPEATTNICDYLCSVQLGGDACQCSNPSLPGKK
ncbi:putative pheromone isoform X1 [Aplysia californica]|uniref:Pheromone isoform X1 n=1 Tax=Aplysia californica TaxID=6500 RepID=Q06AD3_APLCA|nr:putative pheromone precursor [Aplysia californica]XP_012939688.1 putative pheromone isoform X1 [Aplysia californica]XP_012939689.1 putative pheromone isoform X1 [Aplysia californica]ABI96181.1 putative pheromone [Aplysia californica]